MSQWPQCRKGGQEDSHHQPTESPGSPVTTAGRRQGLSCPTLEAAALWGELLQKTLSPGETDEASQKVFLGNVLLLKASFKTSLC